MFAAVLGYCIIQQDNVIPWRCTAEDMPFEYHSDNDVVYDPKNFFLRALQYIHVALLILSIIPFVSAAAGKIAIHRQLSSYIRTRRGRARGNGQHCFQGRHVTASAHLHIIKSVDRTQGVYLVDITAVTS